MTGATAEEIDEAFDRGDDMSAYFDLDHGRVQPPVVVKEVSLYKKVNVDLPLGMVEALDDMADGAGVTRQGLIKMWLWERLRDEQERNVRLGIAPVSVKESE